MSYAVVPTRAAAGIEAPEVTVEVHLGGGLPAFTLVGLPETAVRESRDRVRAALAQAGFEFPVRRITVNLAPADLPKEGGRFDLPVAVGLLAASGQVPREAAARCELLGELALDGALRPVRGALPAALAARAAGRPLVLPAASAAEAALVPGAEVYGAGHLAAVAAHLAGERVLEPARGPAPEAEAGPEPDLADVRGQPRARRALEVAAAGGHGLLMVGPPGTGKTLLASRLPGILPPMSLEEALETAAVASLAGEGLAPARWRRRPFRAPHHGASAAALVGGGTDPRPGEVSLAHNGVLFLDELPEFDRRALESLREPLESGRVVVARAARRAVFPARFQLVAAMNPCPCGHLDDPSGRCRCTPDQVRRYRARLSGPLLDRIDLHVEVPRVPVRELAEAPPGEPSTAVRARVLAARERALARQGVPNAALAPERIEEVCAPDAEGRRLLHAAAERLGLSARAFHRVLRVARTVADLAGRGRVTAADVAEALSYRQLDRGAAAA